MLVSQDEDVRGIYGSPSWSMSVSWKYFNTFNFEENDTPIYIHHAHQYRFNKKERKENEFHKKVQDSITPEADS